MARLVPRASIRDADRFRSVADDLLSEVEANVVTLTSPGDLAALPRHFAALGLARASRLCRAIERLVDADLPDVASLPVRPVLETVLLSFYTLFGGADAYNHVRGAYIRDLGNLSPEIERASQLAAAWQGPRDKIQWEDLTRTVGKMLADHTGEAGFPTALQQGYDVVYRNMSSHSVHAGAGTIGAHIDRGDRPFVGVRLAGDVPNDGTAYLLMAVQDVGLLGCFVLDAFGRETDRLRALYDTLATLGPEHLVLDA